MLRFGSGERGLVIPNKRVVATSCIGVGLVLLLALTWFSWGHQALTSVSVPSTPKPEVIFNQKIIEGLLTTLNLDDPVAVFKAVFSALEEEVVVYPTENYYYFQIYTNGKTIWGNLQLDAHDRDQGIIHLGYFEFDGNGQYQDIESKAKAFSTSDGVIVKRVRLLIYSVTYSGKTVTFRLNDVSQERPARARLREGEILVGPIFDESGLKFFLVFNDKEKHLFYILNEETSVPETFITIDQGIVIGKRTSFAFFADTKNQRKILIAAHNGSVDQNNYYDGPFDQLPDNHVEHSSIAKYIEQAYPYTKGQIDRFGAYQSLAGSRVLIFPYVVYYQQEQLISTVKSCRDSHFPEDKFYACITRDAQQFQAPGASEQQK